MTTQRRWPDGPDEVSAELRRALDEASLRGPDDMTLRRGWSAVAVPVLPARPRRGFWFAGGVATTTALVLAGSFLLWPRSTELASGGHQKPPARSESPIPSGARRLTLEGGVEAVLGRSSVMRLEDGAPRIEKGEVRFSVPHRQPGHPFVVRAEGYRVVVVGTRFGINVDGNVGGQLDGKADSKSDHHHRGKSEAKADSKGESKGDSKTDTKRMAEDKNLEAILFDSRELRRVGDELINASEELKEQYERLRRRTPRDYRESADLARKSSEAAKESSDRHKRDLSQSRRVARDAAEEVGRGKNRRDAGWKK